MPFSHVLICCKVAVASGCLAGVLNTITQTVRTSSTPKLLWEGAESLQAFAIGAALGTLGSVPYLVYHKGLTLTAAVETLCVTVTIVSPAYLIAFYPRTARHLSNHLPVYLGGEVLVTSAILSTCSYIVSQYTEESMASLIGIETIIATVSLGSMSILAFMFVNRLAVSEIYFLYDSVLPRDRNAPEVDTFRGLVRFTQGWGNATAVALLYTSLFGDYTTQLNLLVLDTSVADLTICNILFLGLFHHMQSVNATPGEKLLQRATWISFIPVTFFSWGSLLLPLTITGVFLGSYQPYWREFDLLEQERCRPVQIAIPAEPVPSATAAMPATAAQPALPAIAAETPAPLTSVLC
jgi:hypothetical protein